MEVQLKYKSLFEKGKHTEAIQLLMKQKDQFDPAIYHYNLGVNLAFVNELPLSRYHLENAQNLGFKSIKSQAILEKVKDDLGVIGVEDKSSFSEHVVSYSLDASIATGVNISLVLLLLFLIKLKSISKTWLKIIIPLVCFLPLLGQYYIQRNFNHAIALEKLEVLRGPSTIFEQTQEVIPGMSFITSGIAGEWIYIYSPSSHRGWIKNKGYLEL